MKKITVLFLIVIALVAYTKELSDTVKIVELTNFSIIKKDTKRTYSDVHTVNIFNDAIENALKVDGIVDVADPVYKFKLAGEAYFLWLYDEVEGGSLMNRNDTHTIYRVTEKDATLLKEILNK